MNEPLVSVIIPAYNAGKYIEKAIRSILNQTYQNLELLIADDASTDNTKSIIDLLASEDNRIRTFHNFRNLHYVKTCNKLFPLCNGAFITFQDADDWSDPRRIEMQVKHLQSNPEIGANAVNYIRVDVNDKELFRTSFPENHDDILKKIPDDFQVLANSLMVRKTVLDDIGPYHHFFSRVGAEHLYWYYLISEKYKVANLKEHLCFFRSTPDSITRFESKNIGKIIITDILKEIITQRRKTGTDCLESNNLYQQSQIVNKLLSQQKHRFNAALRFAWELQYKNAFKTQFKGLIFNPLQNYIRYKELFYYFRMMLFYKPKS